MISDWLSEFGMGIGRFFVQPMTYWAVFLLFMASVRRIRRERRDFGSKVFNVFAEWRKTIGFGLVVGLILSIATIASGFVFPSSVVLLWSVVVILLTLTFKFHFVSPAYTLAATFGLLVLFPSLDVSFLPQSWLEEWSEVQLSGVAVLLAVLLFVEAFMYHRFQNNDSFPQYVQGGRGKLIGQQRLKRLSFLPVFFLIPGGAIEPFAQWWPMFSVGGESYGLMVAPILLGFEHAVRGLSPREAAERLRSSMMLISFVVLGLAIGSFFVPILALVAVIVAPIGREVVSFMLRWSDQGKHPYFTPRHDGLPILGVIPGSPADDMKLIVGETIEKVNGLPVANEKDFYHAVQSNLAYCKIAVRDSAGEIRFAKRAMYENDPYGLGLVFVKDQYSREKRAK